MKMTAKQKVALKKRLRETFRKSIAANTKVNLRKSGGDPHIEVVKKNASISKYLRGVCLGIWDEAEIEKGMFQKALSQDHGHRGGVFVPTQLSSEIIPLLQATSVVRSMPGVQVIQMETDKIRFNRVNTGPVISWGSENTAITEDTTLEFGDDTLEAKKAVCLYKMSRELLMNANISIDALVRQQLAKALALEEDKVFLEGTGGEKPLGLYYNLRVNSTDLSAVVDFDNILDAEYQVENSCNGALRVNGWITAPRTVNTLRQLKDAEGRYIYADNAGAARIPTLYGSPLKTTTQVPIASARPAANESYIVGGNWGEFLIGENGGLRIDTSTEADTAFAADQVWIRLVKYVGCLPKQPEAFVVIKGISA